MNRPELYQKTVGILVDAYFNDTLQGGDCWACAVGNLICANIGCQMVKADDGFCWVRKNDGTEIEPEWNEVHCIQDLPEMRKYKGEAKIQIDATGYSPYETCRIEQAFEWGLNGSTDDEAMFNGLCAVIDCLDIIHENTDQSITQQSKKRFDKSVPLI